MAILQPGYRPCSNRLVLTAATERYQMEQVHPSSRGRSLIWDATCVNTFASSNLIRAALAAGAVADAAEFRKIAKYAELGRRFIFQPVAVETSGAMGKSTIQFFLDLAVDLLCDFRISARVISCSRECLWLFSGGKPSAFCSRTVIR